VTRPNPAQLERARRLLAHEGAAGSAGEPETTAASRVYDKIHAHTAPLVGSIGVQLLFLRSAKLAKGDFECFAEVSSLEGPTKLRERLQAKDPAVTMESAAMLFATFFALLTTFIGERLTNQVLRSAWSTLEGAAPWETNE